MQSLYLFPSGCVITMSISPQEAFPRLNDPPQMTTTYKKRMPSIKRIQNLMLECRFNLQTRLNISAYRLINCNLIYVQVVLSVFQRVSFVLTTFIFNYGISFFFFYKEHHSIDDKHKFQRKTRCPQDKSIQTRKQTAKELLNSWLSRLEPRKCKSQTPIVAFKRSKKKNTLQFQLNKNPL